MNMVKLNDKLTAQVVSFTEIVQSYQGIEQTNSFLHISQREWSRSY